MPTLIGIDIGTTSVKAVALKTSYRKMSIAGMGSAPVDPTTDLPTAIRNAVRAVVGEKGVAGESVSTSLEGTKIAVRNMQLPASAQKQIGEVLPFELDGEIPFELSEAVFDYRVLGPGRPEESDPTKIDLVVGVAKIEDAKARIELVKSAVGVEPERVGIGGFPLANLVPHLQIGPEEVVLMADIGTKSTDVLVIAGGEPVFERTVSYGTFGVPETAPKLARELRATVNAFRAIGGKAPTRAMLCGGGAFTSGAASYLGAELQIPVDFIPTPQIDVTGPTPEQMVELPRYAKALGLAVGLAGRALGLDMRKGPLSFERGFAWMRDKVPVLAGLGVVIAVSFFFSACSQMYARSKERATLEKALGTVSQEVLGEETTSASRANELLGQQTATSDDDPMPHADAFDVMVRISDAIPQSVVHDIEELDIQKGHVVVHGIAGTIPEAQSIATSLQTERCFSDVKITRFNQVVGGERQKYVMEFDLKCPEDVKGAKKKDSATASSGAASASGGK